MTQSHTSYPGYTYDEQRHCYFRVPPKHFQTQLKTVKHDTREQSTADSVKLSGCSLHNFLQQRKLKREGYVHSLRLLNEYVLPTIKKKNELNFSDIPSDFIQYDNIMIDGSGELLAVKYTSESGSGCSLYQLGLKNASYAYNTLWKSSLSATSGFYSMDFTTDGMKVDHFLSLHSESIFMAKYVDNKRQWNQTKRLSKAASSLKIYPNSSEWHKLYFAVGLCSGSVQIYNINHKISFSSPRIKSDILSLAFSLHDPLLFAGYRNGTCYVWDIRLNSSPITTIKEPLVGSRLSSSVICLHPLHDHNYIISNALNSQLCLWDLRMQRKVLLFSGHINEYKSCKSIVDKLGSFVAAVGSDGNTRIWSIRTGALIHCLHTSSTNNELPLITYSESLGGASGKPSLLLTENNSLLVYHM